MSTAPIAIAAPLLLGCCLLLGRSPGVQRMLLLALGAGALVATALAVGLLEFGALTVAPRDTLEGALVQAFFGAALPEETLKVLLLTLVIWQGLRRGIVTPMVGVLAGLAVGFGFAGLENAFYNLVDAQGVDLMRLFTAMPCHVCLGAVSGAYVVYGIKLRRPWLLVKAWLIPVFAHGLYNLPLVMDLPPMPWVTPADDALLSGLVLLWLLAWTRLLFSQVATSSQSA